MIADIAFCQTGTDKSKPARMDSSHILDEVKVNAIHNEKAVQLQPVNVSVIDARPYYNTTMNGIDLLKQTSGIKVRQEGGYGSNAAFFINGSTGRQVKFFIDGIPQDYLGETQRINIFPVEQTERIEVYKGVLPVDLGADALGAAINIVTRKERQDYVNASYSFGSYNTHHLNFLGKKYFGKKFFAELQTGASYTDNNYRILGEIPNQYGNLDTVDVKRFHDQFKNYTVRASAGILSTRWADQFVVTLVSSGLGRQIQNNLVMTQPYGNAFYKENLFSGIIRYQKNNLLKNLNFGAFASYNHVKGLFVDTSKNIYNWYGKVVDRKFSGGEIVSSGNELNTYTDIVNAKISTYYRLTDHVRIVLSNTFLHYNRTGKDSVAQNYYNGVDFFSNPSAMAKNISGISIDGDINNRLKFSSSAKYLYAHLKGYTLEWSTLFPLSQDMNKLAYNAALSYRLTEKMLLKTSYEHAARLPEPEEAFGDLMQIRANPGIQPEVSNNINLNFLYSTNKLKAEVTGFYRDVSNIIYLRPSLTSAIYQNLLKVRVTGAEAAVRYFPIPGLMLNGNITFQDLRNQSVIDGGGINNDRYKNARMPNVPYLFANGGIAYTKKNLLKKNTATQFWWNTSYTREYFLYWEVDGDRELKNRIPTQLLQYIGVSYMLQNKGISFALEVNNLTAEKAYDNFKAQLPGRSFSFKVRFYQFKNL